MLIFLNALQNCCSEAWRNFRLQYHSDANLTDLQEKYGLVGRIDWRTDTNCKAAKPGSIAITFIRILQPGETPGPPPPGFVREATTRLRTQYRKVRYPVAFFVHPTGMTLDEIQAEQTSWNSYCEMAWAASG